ncbi:hypothetical protein Lal_00045019, partial [Lupinus albus]
MEFLRLEQGSMSVGEYAAIFEELARFCPYSELEMDGRMYEDDLTMEVVETPRANPLKNFGPQRRHTPRAKATNVEGLIQGNCTVAGIPLLVLFDSGATHSFVSNECEDRQELQTESLPYDLVISTPTDVPVVVST